MKKHDDILMFENMRLVFVPVTASAKEQDDILTAKGFNKKSPMYMGIYSDEEGSHFFICYQAMTISH